MSRTHSFSTLFLSALLCVTPADNTVGAKRSWHDNRNGARSRERRSSQRHPDTQEHGDRGNLSNGHARGPAIIRCRHCPRAVHPGGRAPGFNQYIQEGIQVQVAQTARVDVVLKIGATPRA